MSRATWENPAARLNEELRAEQARAEQARAERDRRIAARRAQNAARVLAAHRHQCPAPTLPVTAAFAQHPRTMVEVLARAAIRHAFPESSSSFALRDASPVPAAGASSHRP